MPMNETQTRGEHVDPALQAAGWGVVEGSKILREYPITPGRIEAIPFDRTRLVSRRLRAGSRLLVVLDVNKNSFHEVNYGTGRDVSTESIADATQPLRVEWRTDSYVKVPMSR